MKGFLFQGRKQEVTYLVPFVKMAENHGGIPYALSSSTLLALTFMSDYYFEVNGYTFSESICAISLFQPSEMGQLLEEIFFGKASGAMGANRSLLKSFRFVKMAEKHGIDPCIFVCYNNHNYHRHLYTLPVCCIILTMNVLNGKYSNLIHREQYASYYILRAKKKKIPTESCFVIKNEQLSNLPIRYYADFLWALQVKL